MNRIQKLLLFFIIIILITTSLNAVSKDIVGEKLGYLVKWWLFKIAKLDLEVIGIEKYNGKKVIHTKSKLETLGWLKEKFGYKLLDIEDVYFDMETMVPVRIVQDIKENSWYDKRDIKMDYDKKICYYNTKEKKLELPINYNAIDLGSFIYEVRFLTFLPGQEVSFSILEKEKVTDTTLSWQKRVKNEKNKWVDTDKLKLGKRVPVIVLKQRDSYDIAIEMMKNEYGLPIKMETEQIELNIRGHKINLNITCTLISYKKNLIK